MKSQDAKIQEVIQRIDAFDHPLVNSERLVEAKENFLVFRLDNHVQAEKLKQLFTDFGYHAENTSHQLKIYLPSGESPDFQVLNTRRAYFFDEFLFD